MFPVSCINAAVHRAGGGVPISTVAPALDDTSLSMGDTVNVSTGTWTGAPTSYAYQWYRGATPIGGATTNSYTAVLADADSVLSCVVTATNATGDSDPVSSNASDAVVFVGALNAIDSKVILAWGLQRFYSANAEALEVRRSSDSTAQGVGSLATGLFDAASFTTFVGGGTGSARTAYDQKGTKDGTQTTAGNQPGVMLSSDIGGRAALTFDGTNSQYVVNGNIVSPTIGAGDFELWIVCRPAVTTGAKCIAVVAGAIYFYTTFAGAGKANIYTALGNYDFATSLAANTNYLLRLYRVSGVLYLDVNGTTDANTRASVDAMSAASNYRWGESGSEQFNGQSAFYLLINGALTSGERDALKASIATLYGLTVA